MSDRILFVDDDTDLLDGIRRALGKSFSIYVADSADKALAMEDESGPFAIVVIDLRMPGTNGLKLLEEFRSRAPDTVRLVLSGNNQLETALKVVEKMGVFRYLTKPISPMNLADILRGGLDQYRANLRTQSIQPQKG